MVNGRSSKQASSFFAACLFFVLFAPRTFGCVIKIAYGDVASPPYYLGDGEAIPAKPGLAVELVDVAAAKLGCKIDWQRMPSKRTLWEMEKGRIDGMLLLSFSDERATYAVYPMARGTLDPSLRLATLRYSFYVREGSLLVWSGKQINRFPEAVGVNVGYSVVQDLRRFGFTVEEASGTRSNLKKLLANRLEAYVGQDLQADLVIEEDHLTGVKKLPIPFVAKDYYLPFSKKFFSASPSVATRLWKEIAEIRRARGKDLLRKYSDSS